MTSADLLVDAFGRIKELVHQAVDGLDPDDLAYRLAPEANSIGWLVWHLTRVQDDHVADVAGTDQVWSTGWDDRFGLPLDPLDTGYGHSSDEVAAVRVPDAALLTAYHDAVHGQTIRFVREVTDADLDRVIDDSWDPPVTLGVRLVSVVGEDFQHVGQAEFLRGVIERRA